MKLNHQNRKLDQRGSTLVEYGLTVLLIAYIAITALSQVGMQVRDTFIAGGGTISTMNNIDDDTLVQKQ